MALLKFPIAWFQLGIVFLAPPTEFWCRQPEDFKHMTVEEWKDFIAPRNTNFTENHVINNFTYYLREIIR